MGRVVSPNRMITSGTKRPVAAAALALIRSSQMLEKLLGLRQLREELLVLPKRARMDRSPAPLHLDRMAQVQHLVKDEIFHRVLGHARAVEDAAYDDGIVRGI